MKMKTVRVDIHVFFRRREDESHRDIRGKQIVARQLDLIPRRIVIRPRNTQVPAVGTIVLLYQNANISPLISSRADNR